MTREKSSVMRVLRGAHDDYRLVRARKSHVCEHFAANGSRSLTVECAGDIAPGQQYLRVRQGWLDTSTLNARCAVAAGIVDLDTCVDDRGIGP